MNSPSDTPLTDTQNAYGYSWNWAEFARGLERGMERHRLTALKQDAEIMCLRAELEDANTRLASIIWSGALDGKTAGEIQKWVGDYQTELAAERAECLEQARLNGMGAEREATLLGKIEVMRRALEQIATYDNGSVHGSGICPYGCDTPHIAQLALCKTGHSTQPEPKP